MTIWQKDIANWTIGKTLYLSVPFTWLLPKAREMATAHKNLVQAGGPAVLLLPDFLADVALVNQPCPVEPLLFHNPLATFTTRGCPNRCGFCAVPQIEGDFLELTNWRVAPIVCDNNLLASSESHFNRVIDRLKTMPYVDFNQGLEAKKLRPFHARRMAELKQVKVRFAFDHVNAESSVADAISLCRAHGLKDFGIFVLIGFRDTPDDAIYRLEKVREWDIKPNPMRYQPLNALEKNSFVGPDWTSEQLLNTARYYSRLNWLEHIPFVDYRPQGMREKPPSLFDDF
jgi:hypothetical protein